MTNEEAVEFLKNMIDTESLRSITAQDKTICQYHIEALLKAISALVRDRWIPCEERLPDRNTEVLVYAIGDADGFWGKHVIAIAERFLFKFFPSDEGEETWSSPWQYFHTDYKITHWRPLPEPPKEEKP